MKLGLTQLASNYSLFNDFLAPLSIQRVPDTPGNLQAREVFIQIDLLFKNENLLYYTNL